MKIPHCYFFKGTYYFRKVISAKYLRGRTKVLILRKSLKQAIPRYYSILENNYDELAKLTIYLNDRIKILLKHKEGLLDIDDILKYIDELCFDYSKNAIKENSSLETKRIESLEYVNENGLQNGYSIQALAKEYKEVISQYSNLSNKQKTIDIGTRILNRSNITKEQILEIHPDQIITFYEMLIKAEKKVLENDIKLYISRNLHQFISLISDLSKDENYKTEEALYGFLGVIRDNELQIDYIKFISKNKQTQNISQTINKDEIISDIFEEMKNIDQKKLLETSSNLEILRDKFIKYKKLSKKREKAANNAINLFIDFMKGNGKEYKTLKLSDLKEEDITTFESLLIEITPRTRSKKLINLNLFELIEIRLAEGKARLAPNTMKVTESYIKDFWLYLTVHQKHLNFDIDLITVLQATKYLNEKMDEKGEETPQIRAFSTEEINKFIDYRYNNKDLKKTLITSPRNFYLFAFALFCGNRLEEPLLTSIDDLKVQIKDGKKYYYLYLNTNKSYQHLKGPNAHRNIPISDLMIDLGFLNYVNLRHKRGCETIFDFPKSGGTSINAFFRRAFQNIFPEACDTREKRDLNKLENFIQFRSLRKNFSNFLFEENRTEFDTEKNKERLMGHDNATTGKYLGRLEPFKAFHIVNSINFENDINLKEVKETIKNHYGEILRDLDWLEQKSPEEWKIVSRVKAKKGRKVKAK